MRVKIKNGDTAFYMRELGIIAKDPDEGEILYAYINFGDGASAMPALTEVHILCEIFKCLLLFQMLQTLRQI